MGIFSKTAPAPAGRQFRSVFNLSHEKKFDAEMGLLYPILVEDCIPGDRWHLSNTVVIRFHQSLYAPLLHNVKGHVHYFFVPFRILWHDDHFWMFHDLDEIDAVRSNINADRTTWEEAMRLTGSWEKYITGKVDGNNIESVPEDGGGINYLAANHPVKAPGGICDFIYGAVEFGPLTGGDRLSPFPIWAYMRIWNEFYREQDYQSPHGLTSMHLPVSEIETKGLMPRNWRKDYFTSALPDTQRGINPALPPGGTLEANTVFDGPSGTMIPGDASDMPWIEGLFQRTVPDGQQTPHIFGISGIPGNSGILPTYSSIKEWLNINHIHISGNELFDVSDLRNAVQLKKFRERSQRGGARYTELLQMEFSVKAEDSRLDRPEFIGGTSQPVIFSETLQTSESQGGQHTAQGNIAGHGISAAGGGGIKYTCKEHGVLMALLSIMPDTMYSQGTERMWHRRSRYEYFWKEFAQLDEQPIFEEEIMQHATQSVEGLNLNTMVFGYTGRYNEYRWRRSTVHGSLRTVAGEPWEGPQGGLAYWHLGRIFSTDVAQRPTMNRWFLYCDVRKDYLPVPTMPPMMIGVGHHIKVIRPLPEVNDPGLLDHF